jgi:methyltransferase (TIGR00027 family)
MEKMVGLPVKHVSETAFLVAAWRAVETERPDAVIHDPLAQVLAGEEGRRLIEVVGNQPGGDYLMAMRTRILDELIVELVNSGADTVVNLAAGLDTRPYRLQLPPNLHWIEVDLPEITSFKEERLAAYQPLCRLTRERIDLSDPAPRETFFQNLETEAKRAVVITEGLLYYLCENDVIALSDRLMSHPRVHTWLMDLVDPRLFGRFAHSSDTLAADDLRFQFLPNTPYFENLGWKMEGFRTFQAQGEKLNRQPPQALVEGNPDYAEGAQHTGILQLAPKTRLF